MKRQYGTFVAKLMPLKLTQFRTAVRRVVSWKVLVAYFRSFKRDQWQIALQIWTSFVLIGGVTAITTVYDALSYRLIAPPLALLFTVWLYSSPFCAGEVNFKIISLIPAAFIGGLIAFGIQRAMYAANDYNWDDDTVTKAAVLVGMATPIAVVVNALRWVSESTNVFFFYINIFIALSINLGAYYAPDIKYLHQWYILANAGIGTGMCALCSNLLFPVTAGCRYRKCMGDSLRSFADAVEALMCMMLCEIDPETGRLANANAIRNPATGYDEGMEERVKEIILHLSKSRDSISNSRSLHFPVLFEIDVYNRPWIFPRHQFMHAKILLSAALSTMTGMLRPLESGRLNMSFFQCPEIREHFNDLGQSIAEMLRKSGDALERIGDWSSVDKCLETMDEAWNRVNRSMRDLVLASSNNEGIMGAFIIAEYFYLFGVRLRAMYGSMAAAVNPTDSSAIPITKKRFEKTPYWEHPSTGLTASAAIEKALEHREVSTEQMDQKEQHSSVLQLGDLKSIKKRKVLRKFMYGHKSNKVLRSRRAYGMPISIVFGIQYGVAVAIALILASIPAVAKYAFIDRPFDVVITVVVVWVPNIGTTTTRGVQRVIGTLLTAAVSYLIITFSYLAAGATWNNEPGKFVVGWAISSFYAAFCVLNAMRDPAREYLWSVANFTLATTTLPVFRADSPWRRLGQRSANMIIGGLIIWLVAIFVLPISTRWMTQVNFATSFKYLGSLMEGISDSVTSEDEDDQKDAYGHVLSSADNSLVQMLTCADCNDETFLALMESEEFETAFKAQLTVGDIKSQIGELEKEFLLLQHPHRVQKGVTEPAADSLQEMLDVIKMLHFLKVEVSPFQKWALPASHYRSIVAFADNVIEILTLLSQEVLRPGKLVEKILEKMNFLEEIALEHMHHQIIGTEDVSLPSKDPKSHGPPNHKGSANERSQDLKSSNHMDPKTASLEVFIYMQNSLTLLNYFELCCCRQLRSLISTVLNAVSIKDPELTKQTNENLENAFSSADQKETTSGMETEYLLSKLEDIHVGHTDGL